MAAGAAKKFYQRALVGDDGHGVRLDARTLKTPGGRVFTAPTRALAQAVAAEWDAQSEHILPASMPLTQLAFAALDGGEATRSERIAYVLKFAETDLCCHRAEGPADLVARQAAAWDPLVEWGAEALGAVLPVVKGVLPAPAPMAALAAMRARAEALDDFALTALAHAAGLAGSALIAFALLEGRLDADAAFAATALDELWSLEHWGEDAEARGRLERLEGEIRSVECFCKSLSAK